jgi:hypothetical protein
MTILAARNALLAATLVAATFAGAQQLPASPPAPATLTTMLCTQDGVKKGLKGKELEEFVGKCIKAKKPGIDKDDAPIADDMANC